MFFEAENLRLI